uniref:Doublecortin domain-containing protein n=1 Tax=Gasterosteus aculeatus aculeatus TaxID=481459 RepID=A0AAQ4RN88_GASAC
MHLVHAEMWDPRPPCKYASPLTPRTPSSRLTTASPAKRITFYKSGDSQFGGVRMAVHKRSFKCFDALLDDLSQKVPLPFGVRTVTTPRGTHAVKHLEQLQDGGCYLCSDRRQTKPVNMELAGKRPSGWYHHGRGPQRPESSSGTPPGHSSHRQRRILLVKNSEPGVRRSLVLNRRSTRSLRAFLDEASEVMQFHIRKLYTAEGRRIDSVQSLTTCPGVLVCVGREAFSPVLVNFIRKSSEEKLPGLGPRTPGNGARSPAAQGLRSPPHGAQSSEFSEGPESKKNVNFGLETKKSIIHPRSDSSNRSARFSLSSEKSYGHGVNAYSHGRPAIMNDDIEKRVLVNKDGSLSVEMRVRFRLQSDETLQWSTQVKKSPSVTNECCPTSQAEADYLQQGQSESCSDPDCASFHPEGVDYSNQPPQRVLEGNICHCCYQRPKQQYDLWENPAHSHRKAPVPPPHASSRTHTVRRHTHSSSSSSSCNSRRVVRCRARVSSCTGGPEQSQLVQEEMFVTEHVESRVEQDEETHVEVCRVSRCCSRTEVVADLRPLSRKSVEDEVMMEEEGERSPSVISCSSHILQSLKGDQDDDLPASASQCCHGNKPSPSPTRQGDEPTSNVSVGSVHSKEQKGCDEETGSRAVSAASFCHCGAADEHSTADAAENDRAPSSMSKTSRASCRSSTAAITEDKRAADEEEEEGNRVVSSLSGHTALSLQSRASSVCPNCGGCKPNSDADSRASQKSHHSKQASPKPSKPLPGQTDTSNGSDNDDDDGSEGSAGSTQSNKSNLTQNGRCSATPSGLTGSARGATSRTSNPEGAGAEEVRTPSASSPTSQRSNRSHKSVCEDGGAAEREGRSPSAVSAVSNKSTKSHKSHSSATAGIEPREEAKGDNTVERTQSSLSAKSGASAKSSASAKIRTKVASPINIAAVEEDDKRTHSALSDKPGRQERPDSVLSAKSAKSNALATIGASQSAACSHCAREVSPADEPEATGHDEEIEAEERAVSAMSAKSNMSVKSNKSHKFTKAPERPLSPRCGTGADGEGRAASQVSGRSVNGRSSLMVEDGQQRSESVISAKSASSAKSRRTNSPAKDEAKTESRTPSAISGKSHISAKSSKSQKSNPTTASPNLNDAGIPSAEMNGDTQGNENGRVASVLSVKSEASARSRTSHKSERNLKPSTPIANVTIKTPDGVDEEGNEETERPQSAASVKSTVSTSSRKSQHKAPAETGDENFVEEDLPSKSQGREPSPRSACSSPTRSPKAASPVQHLLPGETRGPSALSVPSTVSAKSCKLKCNCGAASAKDERQREKKKSNEELDNEEASDRAPSILSSSTRRSRRESGGTEQTLSRNSSGSVSLGLPEDQDTADSDSGKSSVSFHTNVERKSKVMTATPLVPKSTEQSSLKEEREETPHNHRAVDIPTIETPGGSQHKGKEDGEQITERGASAFSAKSSRSNKSSCNCGVKAPTEAGNYLETASVKSGSSSSNAGAIDDRRSLARAKVRSKSPSSASAKNASVRSKGDDSGKGHKAKSSASVRTSSSQKKEIKSLSPVHSNRIGGSKVETHTESTLSHSLSAADMLKETMAAVRPHSQQSKASKTSGKSVVRKGARSRNEADQEDRELSPACLPNASPNEVVSEWLRSIPANSSMLSLGDEPNEEDAEENPKEGEGEEMKEAPVEVEEQGKEEAEEGEEKEEEVGCGGAEEKQSSGVAPHDSVSSRPKTLLLNDDALPRSSRSSAAVMKILLRSSLSRCQSMPEVSPVYGRKLSSSARCLLDCLAQLQVIDPSLSPGFDPKKDQKYEDFMVILQSLWLTEPRNTETEAAKVPGTEQVSPPRSSSGLGMSLGSGGSGKEKENGNPQSKTNGAEKVVEGGTPDVTEGPAEEQSSLPPGLDGAKAAESPSSSDKSSANGCCKSPTDNERETPDDTSSTAPSTILRAPMSKRKSHDPDPEWVLKLLKKLEKQFMDHYVNAMAEFKVRWDLDDNLVLDAMIGELKDEVSRRIQSSVESEVRKIQSRAGRGGRLPRPPQRGNLSKESTMTENRRRILKVIKNQSRKTAESLSDGETTGDCSDQRSEDEYCPCDACVLKKMAARPVRENPLAAEAPVMMEFDLRKILQLKKTPAPAAVSVQPTEGGGDGKVSVEEGRSLEVLQEVEEEDEEDVTKEDIKACVVLEETIPEEEEEMGEEEDKAVEEVEAEREESSAGEEQEEEGGEEAGEEETSENGEEEEAERDECEVSDFKEDTEETSGRDSLGEEASGETEEDNAAKREESTLVEEFGEGNVSSSAGDEEEGDDGVGEGESDGDKTRGESEEHGGEASEEERTSLQGRAPSATEGEEADGEDSDGKRPSNASVEEGEGRESTIKGDGSALLHQYTRTSVESQPGSLEDVDAEARRPAVDSMAVPKATGGGSGQRRSRSPGRVQRRKPKEADGEQEDF